MNILRVILDSIHKTLDAVAHARNTGVKIGKNSRLLGVRFGSEPYLVSIGDHFSGTNVDFITHDGGVWIFRQEQPNLDVVSPISVGDNVFIGSGAIVLPGVPIGSNVVIGAGAIVSRSIPSNCIAAGNPAKPIKSIDEYKA